MSLEGIFGKWDIFRQRFPDLISQLRNETYIDPLDEESDRRLGDLLDDVDSGFMQPFDRVIIPCVGSWQTLLATLNLCHAYIMPRMATQAFVSLHLDTRRFAKDLALADFVKMVTQDKNIVNLHSGKVIKMSDRVYANDYDGPTATTAHEVVKELAIALLGSRHRPSESNEICRELQGRALVMPVAVGGSVDAGRMTVQCGYPTIMLGDHDSLNSRWLEDHRLDFCFRGLHRTK
jgi:hypothetical protein